MVIRVVAQSIEVSKQIARDSRKMNETSASAKREIIRGISSKKLGRVAQNAYGPTARSPQSSGSFLDLLEGQQKEVAISL